MSVWRNLLKSVLGLVFRTGAVAADAAVNKQDVGDAVKESLKNTSPEELAKIEQAAKDVAEKTAKSIEKSK